MLELKNLSFNVENGEGIIEIVDDINLYMEDGEILVITGPNGGGKSTIAKLIMGIEKPTSGQILFDGVDITDMSITERAKLGIGYAFQQPPKFKGLTVKKLLNLAAGRKVDEEVCCRYLSSVGLCSKEYINREIDSSLSGGELKRIEIASLMARNPKLAIYDEPEAGIDLWSFSMLVNTFENFSKINNQGIIIISHQERIINLADRIVLISNGKIQNQGSKKNILPILKGDINRGCGCNGREVTATHESKY
ncbi:ATP-binding cassette domain-containing protein [Romboutsia ilealis]|uniref:ATP-binding cassette domain-containing protein n=1 Tax=Romboutsia faecis TaxID=2764597 RepID=A0ABR7JMT2_9FIRM|nr:ATP-binding cassette domain-containing protein [Romboutsia faecis]MBC5996244.1 ATP-binding cassette domain-containing protein [Romboutsia faecis]MRN25114.1 ATP-binding cassette domain-containing protein [Romboutsia ilealis]